MIRLLALVVVSLALVLAPSPTRASGCQPGQSHDAKVTFFDEGHGWTGAAWADPDGHKWEVGIGADIPATSYSVLGVNIYALGKSDRDRSVPYVCRNGEWHLRCAAGMTESSPCVT